MAATMATMNMQVVAGVAAASSANAASVARSAPASCTVGGFSSFRGQRLAAVVAAPSRGALRSPVVQVRAEDSDLGKQAQDIGESFSAKVQETAENVKDTLQGAQSDASSKASSAARTGQSKVEQGADDAEGLGAKVSNQAEDLKNNLFGGGKDVQKDAEKNLNKAKSTASSKGKEAQGNAESVVDQFKKGVSDAVDSIKGNN